jgi:1-acyl-sn-glycerol-3-phosphate acyltransferase
MSVFRSYLFNAIFYPYCILYAVVMMPCLITRRTTLWGTRLWAKIGLFCCKSILGLDYRVQYQQPLAETPAIYASKHQSAWETIALWVLVPNGIFVLKRELQWIPFFGFWVIRGGNIALDRKAGMSSIKQLLKEAKESVAEGYSIIIFPEGTRTLVGETKPYLPGVAALYKNLQIPVVPIALNSGKFWQRNALAKQAGVIDMVFLEPIAAGQDSRSMQHALQNQIETCCSHL